MQPAGAPETAARADCAASGQSGNLHCLRLQHVPGAARARPSGSTRTYTKRPEVAKPKALIARAPNQVWSWDITYLTAAIKGAFYRLYMVLDIYSRKIVGWEVHHDELASHAAQLITKASRRERVVRDALGLHADNGSPMKGATMLATLQNLGILPSFSRPSVSNNNPYSESLFRTLKYTPAYPHKVDSHRLRQDMLKIRVEKTVAPASYNVLRAGQSAG